MVKKTPEIRIATVEMERSGRGPESEMATLPASNRGQRGIGGSEEAPEKHNVSNREMEERQETPPKGTSLFIVMSFIYAKLLVVVCIAFQISEVVTHNVPLHYYDVFFTYLYGASILYLLYVFCYLLTGNGRPERRPPPKKKKKQKEEKEQQSQGQKNKAGYFQQESYPRKKKHQNRQQVPRVSSPIPVISSQPNTPTSGGVVITLVGSDDRDMQSGKDVEGGEPGTGGTSPLQEKLTGSSHELVQRPRKRKTSENDHGHGSFFLRVGAIAFGLGTMIHNGLELGSWFEIPETSQCYQILRGINPILQMIFTFMQMYFIFMNSRLNIHRFKVISRFGLMHVVATNVCVWIRTLVLESLKEISQWRMRRGEEGVSEDYMILEGLRLMANRKSSTPDMSTWFNFIPSFINSFTNPDMEGSTLSPEITTTTMATTTPFSLDPEVLGNNTLEATMHPTNYSCGRINIMGNIVQDSAPYLYPFIIEYSLIGAAVIYVMWSRIGRNPKYISCDDEEDGLMAPVAMVPIRRATDNGKVDCVGASKGLFFGLLLLVGSLICLILFFVLIQHKDLGLLAIYLADVSHCAILALAILSILIGFIRVQSLKFHTDVQNDLNDILLRISAFGLFIYAVFSVIAGSLSAFTDEPNLLVLITGILVVVEVVLQLLFIADVSRRRVHLPEHERSKPGRQVVTFLLICNITMWVIYTFETQKVEANPVQLDFYGFLAWALVQRVTVPLCIYHRFHAAVAFAEIWKTSYKPRLE